MSQIIIVKVPKHGDIVHLVDAHGYHTVKYSVGHDVLIISGQYLGSSGGISNFWEWRRVFPDGSLGNIEIGYAKFAESRKKYTVHTAIRVEASAKCIVNINISLNNEELLALKILSDYRRKYSSMQRDMAVKLSAYGFITIKKHVAKTCFDFPRVVDVRITQLDRDILPKDFQNK